MVQQKVHQLPNAEKDFFRLLNCNVSCDLLDYKHYYVEEIVIFY